MNLLQISKPLLKQNKILQVDYFTSKMIQTPRQGFKGWDEVMKVSKQQQKLIKYFQNEQQHNQKYYRYKKLVNQKYFNKQLPEDYKNSTISQTLKGDDFLYSPRFQNFSSSLMSQSINMDNSVSDFVNNFQSYKNNSVFYDTKRNISKTSQTNRKYSKSFSRYWPAQDNISVILQEQQTFPLRIKKKQTSIYQKSVGKGINQSFITMKVRPMSQQLSRKTQKVKKIIRDSLNPQANPKNIRHRLSTLTEKHKLNQKYKKVQQNSILDIISKQKLMKFLRESRSIDPKRKGIFSLDDLSDFQKFHMSFINYMKLKSLRKINKYASDNKVKQKNDNMEKFQNFILDQFPMDSDSKRKLQKLFQNINWEFKRAERRKQVQKR